MAMKLNETSEI